MVSISLSLTLTLTVAHTPCGQVIDEAAIQLGVEKDTLIEKAHACYSAVFGNDAAAGAPPPDIALPVQCTGGHSVDGSNGCHDERCRGLKLCVPECRGCPDIANSGEALPPAYHRKASAAGATAGLGLTPAPVHCRGNHSVDGSNGCHDERCRGLRLCVPDCRGCPDIANSRGMPAPAPVHCMGNHPVDGSNGCHDERCRGLTLCVPECRGCPGIADPDHSNATPTTEDIQGATSPKLTPPNPTD
jgi:hypothetical protein